MESVARRVRPTLRCLKDVGAEIPTLDQPLDAIPDSPVKEAQNIPVAWEAGGVRRIRSLKDRVWFKVKTSRWRAAVTRLRDEDTAFGPLLVDGHRWWLCAAGHREDGSRDDFYAALEAECSAQKSADKPNGIDTDSLLPREWDLKRLRAETALLERLTYEHVAVEAAARSLRTGKVVTAQFPAFSMGVLVRADRGEQFIAFIARDVYDPRQLAVMLDSFPRIANNDWAAEPGGIANLQPRSGEVVWSALLDPAVADEYLERVPPHD